jgi:hypothetical protein
MLPFEQTRKGVGSNPTAVTLSSRTDLPDDVFDITSSALDAVELKHVVLYTLLQAQKLTALRSVAWSNSCTKDRSKKGEAPTSLNGGPQAGGEA